MSIGQRIALLVVLAITVGMGLFAAYNIRARRAELLGEAVAESAELGFTLDVVLNEMLEHRDLDEIEHMPDQIARARRIFGMAVLDANDGELFASRTVTPRQRRVRLLAEAALRARAPRTSAIWFGTIETSAYAFPLRSRNREVIGAAVVLRDLTYMDGFLAASRRRITLAGAVVALLATALVLIATRRTITRPVGVLIEGVRRIGDGDLTRPIPVARHDEVGRIAQALNRMMADLAAARVQIREDLERRIALEKSVEFERRLQHAQRLATVGQVAASLAHEIGSPLHVIAGRARYAAGREDPAEMRENLLVIATQADRITRVVEQLLSVARRRGPRVQPVALTGVARTVVDLLKPQATQQGVDLRLVERKPNARTTGDPDALQQVLFNLVLNALQAQPGGGKVEIVLDEAEERDSLGSPRPRTLIEVRDRGPGVPAESREAIFEPFTTSREGSGGTGLGLAVVREIVRDHAGVIRVFDNEGGGALFRISLPSYDEDVG